MPTKLQIKWELPPDLANVAASILYRAEDPGQNKTCQDVVNTGSLVVKDTSPPFQNNYIDELDKPGYYRYSAFIQSHKGELSECATFVYNYDDTVQVKIITNKNEATVSGFGTEKAEGSNLVYTDTLVQGTKINLSSLVNPKYENSYVVKEVHVFSKNTNQVISGLPDIEISEETEISIVCHKASFTIWIKGDPEYFKQSKKLKNTDVLKKYKVSSGKTKKITLSMHSSKKKCYEFDQYTAEGPDPYGQENYDPTDSSTKIIADQNYVLVASQKEKISELKLSSSDDAIGEVIGAGEYTCFDDIQITAKPIEDKVKFKYWDVTFGKSRISEGDPTTVPEGPVSKDPINYGPLRIQGNVNAKAVFTKVFQIVLKIMGPNGIIGNTSRGNVGILVTPEEMGAITGNSMTANVEAANNPFDIRAVPKTNHKFGGWQLISGNVTGISGANSTINILSDAELHAIFIKIYDIDLIVKYFGTSAPSGKTLVSSSLELDEVNNNLNLKYSDYKPAGNFVFSQWEITSSGSSTVKNTENLNFLLNDSASVVLELLEFYVLTVEVNLAGSGTTTGSGNYNYGNNLNIPIAVNPSNPTVAPAYQFLNWTSSPSVSLPSNTSGDISITQDTTVRANFKLNSYTLTLVTDSNKGTVSQSGGPTYSVFDSITISSNPKGKNIFQKWEVVSASYGLTQGQTFNFSNFTLGNYGNLTLVARFLAVYTLTVKYYQDGVHNPAKTVIIERKENEPSAVTVNPLNINAAGYEFDRWEVESGAITISDPNTYGAKTVNLTSDAVVAFHVLKGYELTLLIDLPGAATFSHGQSNNFFRNTEDINIPLVLSNPNASIPAYKFNNLYSATNPALVSNLKNNSLNNTIRINGDVSITAHLDYVLYNFSASVDSSRGSISGTSPNGTYNVFENITLNATPKDPARNIFKEWRRVGGSEVIGSNQIITLAPYGNLAAEAIFENKYNLKITVNYPDITDESFSSDHMEGSSTTVDIVPLIKSGYRFLSWDSNPYINSKNSTTFSVNSDIDITVNVLKVFTLHLESNIPSAAVLTGAGGYLASEDASIEAIINAAPGQVEGYAFQEWRVKSGSILAGTGMTGNYLKNLLTKIKIQEDTVIEAIFSAKEYNFTVESESSEGTVGINNNTKGTLKSIDALINESISVQNLAASNHQFFRFRVVSADQGVTPGDTFTNFSGFSLANYGNLRVKAEFLRKFTLTVKVYLDGSLSDTDISNLIESSYNSDSASANVSWPSVAGYITDTASSHATSFNVNDSSNQSVTVNPGGTIEFFLRKIEGYSLIIKRQIDLNSAQTVQTLAYDEVNNNATIPAISIPSGHKFDRWEISSGTTPTSFSNLNKSSWPTNSSFLMSGDVTLTYKLLAGYELTIQANYPSGYPDSADRLSTSIGPNGPGPYYIGDNINIGATIPNHLNFNGWSLVSGSLDGSLPGSTSGSIGIKSNTTIRVNMSYKMYSFSIVNNSNGNISGSSASGNYNAFQDITLRANPNSHYQFKQWEYESSPGVWSVFGGGQSRTINLTGDLKLRPVFEGVQYTLTVVIDDPSWGTSSGAGTYAYNTSVNLKALPNQGYEFNYWYKTSGVTPLNFSTSSDNQNINIVGDVVLTLHLKALPLPRDGNGNILFPELSSSSNRGSLIDRNMLAMTKDGGAVVLFSRYRPTAERIKAVTGSTASNSSILGSTDFIGAIRVINKNNSGDQVEAILPLVDSLSGYRYGKGIEGISFFRYGVSKMSGSTSLQTEARKGFKGRLAVSPDGTKVMCGNPGDYLWAQTYYSGRRITVNTPMGSTEIGHLNIGSVNNTNADGDVGDLVNDPNSNFKIPQKINGSSDIEYFYSRQTSKTFFGHSISMAKNFVIYSAPSSVSGYLPLSGSSSSGISPHSAPAFSSSADYPGNSNVIYIVPNQYLNNNSLTGVTQERYNDQYHSLDQSDYISFDLQSIDIGHPADDGSYSQFGRSVDIARDAPSLSNSSESNPIFVVITSVWKPNNSLSHTNWTRSKSITKVVGIYQGSSGPVQIGVGRRESSSSVKNPTNNTEFHKLRAAWNAVDINVDEEDVIDYNMDYNTNSDYGIKTRISADAKIVVITNSKHSKPRLGTGYTFKNAEVKVLLRRNITINYNSKTYNWFEYENVQNLNLPNSHNITADGNFDFGYDIDLRGNYLAVSAPSEKTVFIYKWNSSTEAFDYWNKIYMSEPDSFGKAVVFDTRDSGEPSKIAIAADESFFVLDIPGKQ